MKLDQWAQDRLTRAREQIDRTYDSEDWRDQEIAVLRYQLLLSEMREHYMLARLVDYTGTLRNPAPMILPVEPGGAIAFNVGKS